MRHVLQSFLAFALAGSLFGCAAQNDATSNEDPSAAADDAISGALPAPGDQARRLYFDVAGGAYLSDTAPLGYFVFGAKGKHAFTVSVSATASDGSLDANAAVGFKLFYLSGKKWVAYKGSIDSVKGVASETVDVAGDHTWLLEASSGAKPQEISASLTCAGGDHTACELARGVGDTCGGIASLKCDVGLYCNLGAACGAGDQAGTCALEPQLCSMIYAPVCGCDGKTYSSACVAASKGVSVASNGACATTCDLTPTAIKSKAAIAGSYESADLKFSYTLTATNGITAIHDPCAAPPGQIHCEIAAMEKTGTYKVDQAAKSIDVTYTDGTTAVLEHVTDCNGNVGFEGTDWNANVTAFAK